MPADVAAVAAAPRARAAFLGLGGAAVVVAVVGLARTKALTTALDPASYGAVTYAFAVLLTVQVVANLGLGTGLRRQAGLDPSRFDHFLGVAAWAATAVGLAVAVPGILVAAAVGDRVLGTGDGSVVLALAVAALPLALLEGLWLDALYARRRARAAARYLVLSRSFAVVAVAAGTVVAGRTGAAAGLVAGFAPGALWGFAAGGLRARLRRDAASVRTLLRDGATNQAVIVANVLAAFAVRSVVLGALGPGQVALHAVALALGAQLTQFVGTGLAGTFFADYASAGPDGRPAVLVRARRLVLLVVLAVVPVALVATPLVLRLLTSGAYAAAVGPARVLLLAAAVEALFQVDSNALFIGGRMGRYVAVQTAGNVVLVAGSVALLGHGLVGVASAALAAQVVQLALGRRALARP